MSTQVASVSLDLDNKWSYLRTRGVESWQDYPTYLPALLPRILDFLDECDLKITFFIVGQDAAREENREVISMIARRGHDVGNHSFRHEPWLHLYSREELHEELARAEECILEVTGLRPTGFRGPGFSITPAVLEVLAQRGYVYDATTFPNVLNPVARAYLLARSTLTEEEKERRGALFGTLGDALRSVRPYWWAWGEHRLLEVPVTTMPFFKLPMHMTYLHFLNGRSSLLARAYLRFALAMCRLGGIGPSMLLHPSDFMGREDDPDLGFFPGMDMPSADKLEFLRRAIEVLRSRYELMSLQQYVGVIRNQDLQQRVPH